LIRVRRSTSLRVERIFAALGFMAHTAGKEVQDVVSGGIGLAFIAFPKIISSLGAGADVVSIGEFKRCLKVSVKPKDIIFSGVGKQKDEIEFAINKNIKQINAESIEELIQTIKKINTFGLWLGLGSNILLPERIKTPVILLQKFINNISEHQDYIYAQAGVTCAKMAKKCIGLGYEKSIFFGGIPGTIGGALNMNAGAFGSETWDHVYFVDVIDLSGNIKRLQPKEFKVSYRHTQTPYPLKFIGAAFKFDPGCANKANVELKKLITKRNESQPIGTFNCGSVFKNPYPQYAASLIESCGLKGYTFEGAQVSEKHANFILNLGDATYHSILHVINHVKATVLSDTKITLKNEVIIL